DVSTKIIDELVLAFTGSAIPASFLPVPNVQSSDDVYVSSRGSSAWGAPALLDPQSSQGAHLWAGHDGTGQVQLFYTGAGGPRRIAGAPGAWNLAASTPAVAGNNSYVSVAVAFGPGGVIHAVYGGIGVGVVYA